MPKRRHFTKQFKEETLRSVSLEGVNLIQVARDLGLTRGCSGIGEKASYEELQVQLINEIPFVPILMQCAPTG